MNHRFSLPVRMLTAVLLLPLFFPLMLTSQEQYLLRKPIQEALETGTFTAFTEICQEKISVNFGIPFELSGYINRDKFIEDFSSLFSGYQTLEIEWASQQIEIPFAVQSLNLKLKNKQSDKTVYYKLILFMIKKDQKWEIYHCRGLSF